MKELYRLNLKNNRIIKLISELFFFYLAGAFWVKRLVGATKWTVKYPTVMRFWENSVTFFDDELIVMLMVYILIRCVIVEIRLKKMLFFSIIIIFAKLSQIMSGDSYMLVITLLIIAANEIDSLKILVLFAIANGTLAVITVAGALSGTIENEIELGRNREFLGFNWTTTAVMLFSYFVFLYIVLKKGEISIFEFIIFSLINVWLFKKTNTRFAFLIIIMTLFMFFAFNKKIYEIIYYKKLKKFLICLPYILFAAIFIISVTYNSESRLLNKINNILSNRLQQCRTAFNTYDVLPFGQKVEWILTKDQSAEISANYVDTAYLQFLFCFGYVSIIILLFFSSKLIYRAYEYNLHALLGCFVIILMFGLTERQLFWIEYDSLLLLTFSDLHGLCKNKEIKMRYKLDGSIV